MLCMSASLRGGAQARRSPGPFASPQAHLSVRGAQLFQLCIGRPPLQVADEHRRALILAAGCGGQAGWQRGGGALSARQAAAAAAASSGSPGRRGGRAFTHRRRHRVPRRRFAGLQTAQGGGGESGRRDGGGNGQAVLLIRWRTRCSAHRSLQPRSPSLPAARRPCKVAAARLGCSAGYADGRQCHESVIKAPGPLRLRHCHRVLHGLSLPASPPPAHIQRSRVHGCQAQMGAP